MTFTLSESTIRARLIEWRNLKQLHHDARDRIETLRETITALKEKLSTSEEKITSLEEALAQKNTTVEKLQKLLFERHEPRTRTMRERKSIARTADSYRRTIPPHIDMHRSVSLTKCPECHSVVSSSQSFRTRIIEDIILNPPPVVTEWTLSRHFCVHCNKLVEANVPGVMPQAQIGPHTLIVVIIAKYRWNMPFAKIRDMLLQAYGLSISEGEVAHLLARAAALLTTKWDLITEAVRLGKSVHCDETGWYVKGEKGWAHVFSTPKETLYVIHETRGKGVVERALGENFAGVRITDCLPNYKNLPGAHQICWAHLTREAYENCERGKNTENTLLSRKLDALYARLRKETESWSSASASIATHWCERTTAALLARSWHDPPSRKLVERLRNFRTALFTCLSLPAISPDNNEAERSLRKLAVQRNISGGNRSWKHALVHAKNMSVIETLRKEGDEILTGLQTLLNVGVERKLSGE